MANMRCNLATAAAVLLAGFLLMGCAALPAGAPTTPRAVTTTPPAAPRQLTPEVTMPPHRRHHPCYSRPPIAAC